MYVLYGTLGDNDMTALSITEARETFAHLVNSVAYRGERVLIERRGKGIAMMIPIEDAEFLDWIEDQMDIQAAKKALKEQGSVSWSKVKKELGL